MEVLFENRYMMTKERYMDWVKNPIRKNYFVIFWLVLMVFTTLMFIISILSNDMLFSFFYVLMAVFCIYRAVFRRKMLSSKYFKSLAVNQGAEEWERVIQFTDNIAIKDGNTTVQYQWEQIDKLIENEKYLILTLKNKLGIRISKDGFTKGTPDTFIQYIKNQYQSIRLSTRR
ncbi:MAG: YcxB family protein [Bacillota bacterium]|nr:YcxB family protein [Bacillota bacterium]